MQIATLTERALLKLSGADVLPFLQGILTNDIHKLSAEHPLYAAILTPQGKFLYDTFAYMHEDGLLLEHYAPIGPELLKKLQMYRLRAKVEIVEMPELNVFAAWGGALEKPRDPRHRQMGYRFVAAQPPEGLTPANIEEYHYRRIGLCIPEMPTDLISGESFPLPSNMEQLQAIDYKKGCYVGQEVTARSKYRGNTRKAIFTVKLDGKAAEAGAPITSNGSNVGTLLSHSGDLALAQLDIEAAQEKAPLQLNGTGLHVILPITK